MQWKTCVAKDRSDGSKKLAFGRSSDKNATVLKENQTFEARVTSIVLSKRYSKSDKTVYVYKLKTKTGELYRMIPPTGLQGLLADNEIKVQDNIRITYLGEVSTGNSHQFKQFDLQKETA